MNLRGQAALEYLMTYGWALVVIIIVIAALFALGILTPATYQGATCRGFGKIAYFDHVLDANGDFIINLGNGTGKNITTGNASFGVDCEQDGTFDGNTATTSNWLGAKTYTFQVSACSGVYAAGSTYVSDVNITYTPVGRLQQVETATCSGTVR